jgi:tetratricopeptide (TPR) repeat protein
LRRYLRPIVLAHRLGLCLGLWLGVLLVCGRVEAAPSGMDQAKKLYGEALAAMDAKDFATAVAKFEGAYQFAPDKHAFNFNIASAAELAGDCRKAQNHYKMFLDLVPKHEARGSAQKAVTNLQKTCIHDDETVSQLSPESREKADTKRVVEEGDRAILEALAETQFSARFYAAVAAQHGDKQPFKRLAKLKARNAKRIEKLIADHNIPGKARNAGDDTLSVPDKVDEACQRGVSQEARNAKLYDKVFDLFEDKDIVRLMDRYARKAELRHMAAFRDACPS